MTISHHKDFGAKKRKLSDRLNLSLKNISEKSKQEIFNEVGIDALKVIVQTIKILLILSDLTTPNHLSHQHLVNNSITVV